MRQRLISTVGTSLLINISRPYAEGNGIPADVHAALREYQRERQWGQLARELAKVDPSARICGAEINSIEEAINRQKLDLQHLHFLVSDTDDGRILGELLENYHIEGSRDQLKTVQHHVIEDLQDDKPKRFRLHGLRNLVRQLGELVQQYGADTIIIDATGGYKAQIAIAVVFGQTLGIPVLYRHERFSEIIEFPPLPITFDYDLLGQNAALLAQFEAGDALSTSEMDALDEKVRVLLEEVEVEGENLFALGAIGQIFLTGFRLRFPRSRELQPVLSSEKSEPSFRDDHYPIGFKDFVCEVCADTPWIKTAHSLPYHKQKSIKRIGFYVREGKLIGTYVDKDGFGGRFEILTNASSEDQLIWAADQLNQTYQSRK